VLMPIAVGTVAVEVDAAGFDLTPIRTRRRAAEFPCLSSAAEIPVNARVALTDWPPIMAVKPTAWVDTIPAGGVRVVERAPLESVVPWLALSVP